MCPVMKVNPEETKAAKPVPADWYDLRIKAGVINKSPKGYNYVFHTEVVNSKADYNGSYVPLRANNGFKQAKVINDICHGVGLLLGPDGAIPGDWKLKDAAKPDDWDGAQYNGPLLGKVINAELIITNYQGVDRNAVRQIKCKIADCKTKFPDILHLTDMT